MPIADLVGAVSVEIQNLTAAEVHEGRAVGGGQRVEAGGGEGLVQEGAAVPFQEGPGLGFEVHVPLITFRRLIDIALGALDAPVVV